MAECISCGKSSGLISSQLKLCKKCLVNDSYSTTSFIKSLHQQFRSNFGLPLHPPRADNGQECVFCGNQCRIAENQRGYCGIRLNSGGRLIGGDARAGKFSAYSDPLPTNCVADWVCPAGSSQGFPRYSYSPGPEHGFFNLAVFFQSCTFNCLFCQNWHYRYDSHPGGFKTPEELAAKVGENTACICFFGGDPSSQPGFALKAARLAQAQTKGKIMRICWETNGSMHPKLMEKAAQISLETGGCIKIDLKAWNENLHLALCGVSNRRTLANFRQLSTYTRERPDPPLLIASTLLIPGYIDEEEIDKIARFIADLNPEIPYALLGFSPHFGMNDLPVTSREHAANCARVAEDAGLTNVRIGNAHLLSGKY